MPRKYDIEIDDRSAYMEVRQYAEDGEEVSTSAISIPKSNPIEVKMKNPVFEFLRLRRYELRLSQTKLAELSGVNRNTISLIEKGDARNIRMETLSKICEALGYEISLSVREPTSKEKGDIQ